MIEAGNYGIRILGALFNAGISPSGTVQAKTVTFPKEPHLALYTQMPAADGSGAVEVAVEGYARVNLTSLGLKQKRLLSSAEVADGEGDDAGKKVASVTNQEEIHFPVFPVGASCTVVGFGVYESLSAQKPYFWGELKEPVQAGSPTNKSAVFFDIGDFKVTLA